MSKQMKAKPMGARKRPQRVENVEPQVTSKDPAEARSAVDAAATVRQSHYVTADTDFFQIRAPRQRRYDDGFVDMDPGLSIDFKGRPVKEIDEDTVEILEKILDGKHSDGTVSGPDFKRIAKRVNLRIIYPGLLEPPIKRWDGLSPDRVVPAAIASGGIETLADVDRAIAYEKQSVKRSPKRDPRERVIADLEAMKAKLVAAGTDPAARLTLDDDVDDSHASVDAPRVEL